jgi:hypothetical protein
MQDRNAGFKRLRGKRRVGTLTGATASIFLLTTSCVVGAAWAENGCRFYNGVCVPIAPPPEKAKKAKKPVCVTPHLLCNRTSENGFVGDDCFCWVHPGIPDKIENGHIEEAD